MVESSPLLPTSLAELSVQDSLYQKGFLLYTTLIDSAPDILSYFAANINTFISNTTGIYRILSVGCGEGQLDLSILNLISQRFPLLDIHYLGIDPNKQRLDLLKEKTECYFICSLSFSLRTDGFRVV